MRALSSTVAPTTSVPAPDITTVPSSTSTSTAIIETGDVVGFGVMEVSLDDAVLTVAVADDGPLRQQGLMFVEDLGDLDGMLFVFDEERSGGFWMKNTLIPLDIAFFDSEGHLVGTLSMVPCEMENCPVYVIGLPYRYALEVPAGDLSELAEKASLSF